MSGGGHGPGRGAGADDDAAVPVGFLGCGKSRVGVGGVRRRAFPKRGRDGVAGRWGRVPGVGPGHVRVVPRGRRGAFGLTRVRRGWHASGEPAHGHSPVPRSGVRGQGRRRDSVAERAGRARLRRLPVGRVRLGHVGRVAAPVRGERRHGHGGRPESSRARSPARWRCGCPRRR